MKISTDTKKALCALVPMILIMVTPMVATATTSMSSQGMLIDELVADGAISLNDPVPLEVLFLIYGPYAPVYYAIGWTWGNLQAQMSFLGLPIKVASEICKLVGAMDLALMLAASGWAYILLGQ